MSAGGPCKRETEMKAEQKLKGTWGIELLKAAEERSAKAVTAISSKYLYLLPRIIGCFNYNDILDLKGCG
jgi:hypothetical protein